MSGAPLSALPSVTSRRIHFDRDRLRWPEWVVGISALVLLIAMLAISWYTFTLYSGGTRSTTPKAYGGGVAVHPQRAAVHTSVDGWNGVTHLHWLLLVTIILAFALVVLQAARRAPAVPVTLSLFVMLLGGLAVIWLLVRVVIDPPAGRDAGGWIALISAVVLTWGAWRSLRLDGIAPRDAPGEIPTVGLQEIAVGRPADPDAGQAASAARSPDQPQTRPS